MQTRCGQGSGEGLLSHCQWLALVSLSLSPSFPLIHGTQPCLGHLHLSLPDETMRECLQLLASRFARWSLSSLFALTLFELAFRRQEKNELQYFEAILAPVCHAS